MELIKPQSYFVIGTDTNVGKTFVTSRMITYFAQKGLKTIGMKPVASGCGLDAYGQFVNEDVIALTLVSNVKAPLNDINPYLFRPAIAPHIAAQQRGVNVNLNTIQQAYERLSQLSDIVMVEGAGGFLVPINETQSLADLVVKLNLPMILVVGMRLGCINHALLTVESIKARGLKLTGWIANEIDPNMQCYQENLQTLTRLIEAPLLMQMPWQTTIQIT
jgi:dethiobiotin synthetase